MISKLNVDEVKEVFGASVCHCSRNSRVRARWQIIYRRDHVTSEQCEKYMYLWVYLHRYNPQTFVPQDAEDIIKENELCFTLKFEGSNK